MTRILIGKRVYKGDSNSTGFWVKGQARAQSKDYQKKDVPFVDRIIKGLLVFCLVLIFLSAGHILLTQKIGLENIGATRHYASIVFLIFFSWCISAFVCLILLPKDRQWHACEHKVANLINKRAKPTLENLKKMSQFDPICGSQGIAFVTLFFLVEYLFMVLTKVHIANSIFCMFHLVFVLLLFISHFFKIGLPTQYLTTKKPTEEQLKEALRVAKEFVKKSKEFEKSRN